jgi:PST family polysaccharide transporter
MTMQRPVDRVQVAKGAVLTGMAQFCKIALSFVSSVFLARLLTPADFGLVAMVSATISLVALIQDLGLNQATIQRERISPAQVSALFWLSTGFGFALAVALAISAPLVAWFFGDSRLVALTIAFAFVVFLSGSQSQQFALLNREMRFKALAAIDVLGAVVGAIVGIVVAWLTSSYWALFAAALASALTGLCCVWIACGFRPGRPSFEGEFGEIVKFGSGVSGFNTVNYFARNADKLLLGRLYGSDSLGLYDRAYRLLLFPLQQVQQPLGRVMLPLLARLQSDPARYRKAYNECVSMMMMAAQPGLVFLIVFADDVFLILLGPHWLPAAPIFRWLGVGSLLQIMTGTLGWLFMSQGRGADLFKAGLFNSVITVASFFAGLPWGPLGVAAAYVISDYLIRLPATLWATGRRGPISVHDLVATTLPHAIASAASGALLLTIARGWPSPSPIACAVLILASYIIYGLVIFAFPAKRLALGVNIRAFMNVRLFQRPA